MAVVGTAREKRGSPGALRESDNGFSITRTFIVETDDHKDGPIVVDRAVGLPQRGNRYLAANESHFYLFCFERSFRRISDNSRFWHVECEYRTPTPEEKQQQDQQQAPEFELPIIRGGTYTELRDVRKTTDTVPLAIVNPNSEPYRPHPQEPEYFQTLFIQRNEPITSPVGRVHRTYCGKLNADVFWGDPAETWLCSEISWEIASRTITNGLQIAYLVVSYTFQGKDTWEREFPRISKNFWDGSTYPSGHAREGQKKLRAFETVDGWGNEGFIDEDGYPTTTLSFDTFKTKEKIAFAGLNLPQSPLAAVPR